MQSLTASAPTALLAIPSHPCLGIRGLAIDGEQERTGWSQATTADHSRLRVRHLSWATVAPELHDCFMEQAHAMGASM